MAKRRVRRVRRRNVRGWNKSMKRYPELARHLTQNTIYKFTRVTTYPQIQTTPTYAFYSAFYFQLADVPNYGEFTTLFDQYMITGIKFMLMPEQNVTATVNDPTLTTALLMPPVYAVADYDDATAPTAVTDLLQYQNLKIWMAAYPKIRSMYIKPHTAVAMYSGTFVSYGNKKSSWIDCNSATVQHYGVKIAIPPVARGSYNFNVICKYYLKFRNVR